jgi:hypothetical protein
LSKVTNSVAKLVFPIAFGAAVTAGSSGGRSSGDSSRAPSVEIASPGGLWIGTNTEGEHVSALVDEYGEFYFLAGPFAKAKGLLTVINQDNVNGQFQLAQEPGVSAPDASPGADCKLDGSISERASMTLDVSCRQTQNQEVFTVLMLSYDELYSRDSSLEIIAGLYDYENGSVLSIGDDGAIFGQNPETECVINGQVAIVDSSYNAYEIQLTYSNCSLLNTNFNGETFFGIATLDNRASPQELVFVVSNEVNEIDELFVVIIGSAVRL